MGQPILTATLALAIAVVFTAAIAIVTLAANTASRAVKVIVVAAVTAFAVVAVQRVNLRFNFTGSVPIGIYLLLPLQPYGVKRGMLIAACPPTRAAEIGRQRGYLGVGPCDDDTELLLKHVAAMAGDAIDVTPGGVIVDGHLLPHSQPASRDHSYRRLAPWPRGAYRLAEGEIWLYAANDWSWDSRYWGPASIDEIDDEAIPLLVAPGATLGKPLVGPTQSRCRDLRRQSAFGKRGQLRQGHARKA